LPLEDMYDEVAPHPNSKHNLPEFLSKRGESKLESFHDRFAHFANCGMRETLASNLNLAGAARFNLSIRHKRSLLTPEKTRQNPIQKSDTDRKKIPAAWEKVIPYFNHSELSYVNEMANDVGCTMPFPTAEPLPDDNGERFFSQYLKILKQIGDRRGEEGECLCDLCGNGPTAEGMVVPPQTNITRQQQQQRMEITNTVMPVEPNQNQTTTPTAAAAVPQQHLAKTVTHNRVGAPAANSGLNTIAPYPYFVHPWVYCIAPVIPPFAPAACCTKYKEWLTTQKGRPLHHPLCSNR